MKSIIISSCLFNEILEDETYLALYKRIQKIIGTQDNESKNFYDSISQLLYGVDIDWEEFNLTRIAWESRHESKIPNPYTRVGLVYISLTQPIDFDILEYTDDFTDYSAIREPFFQIEGLLMASERETAREMGLYDEDDFNYAKIA